MVKFGDFNSEKKFSIPDDETLPKEKTQGDKEFRTPQEFEGTDSNQEGYENTGFKYQLGWYRGSSIGMFRVEKRRSKKVSGQESREYGLRFYRDDGKPSAAMGITWYSEQALDLQSPQEIQDPR